MSPVIASVVQYYLVKFKAQSTYVLEFWIEVIVCDPHSF